MCDGTTVFIYMFYVYQGQNAFEYMLENTLQLSKLTYKIQNSFFVLSKKKIWGDLGDVDVTYLGMCSLSTPQTSGLLCRCSTNDQLMLHDKELCYAPSVLVWNNVLLANICCVALAMMAQWATQCEQAPPPPKCSILWKNCAAPN